MAGSAASSWQIRHLRRLFATQKTRSVQLHDSCARRIGAEAKGIGEARFLPLPLVRQR